MRFRLGSFTTDLNTVWFSYTARRDVGQTGGYITVIHNLVIHHVVYADSLTALRTKLTALEQAVANITGDVIFESEGGTALHTITYGATINGIRGSSVAYPGGLTSHGGRIFGSGSEMADSSTTFRYVVTTITARELSFDQQVVFYHDSLSYSVGGTQFVVQGAFQGPPRRFNTMQQAPNTATQRGRAISVTTNPAPANPIINALAMDPQRSRVTYETPQVIGNLNQILFPTSWEYHYKDAFPMPGIPAPTP